MPESDLGSQKPERTLLLVDDHPAWSDFLGHSLRELSGFVVKGHIGSKREALVVIKKTPPDVLVLNVKLNDGCGLGLCQSLQQMKVPTVSLILTSYDEDAYLARALTGGAMGYLLKTEALETIRDAIHRAAQGEVLWSHDQLLRARRWQQVAGNPWAALTEREREVVTALVHFKSNNEIAEDLHISPHTVHNHISQIFEKLGMRDRSRVARWAVEHKLVEW